MSPQKLSRLRNSCQKIGLSRLSPAGGGDVIALASPLLLAKEDCRRAGLWRPADLTRRTAEDLAEALEQQTGALSGAQIRMYGGGDGTMDALRGLFTQGFGIGEVLEGLAQSLPEGLRQRFNANGIRGLLGRPYDGSSLKQTYEHLNALVLGTSQEQR